MLHRQELRTRRSGGKRRSRALARWSGLLLWVAAFGATGCGRKATVEDCERIVKRIAELELQNVVSKDDLGTEVQQAQQTFRDRALSDCVGRRITEKSLRCVEEATTAAMIIDECFD